MWLDLHGSPMGILKPCCIWWWPWWGRGSLWWRRRHGSWGRRSSKWWRRHGWISWRRSNPLPCSGLLLPARHRSPTQRRPRLPGEEARLERNWRQDLKGQDRDWKGTPYMRAREIGGNDGAREIVARSAGGALGSLRRSGISGMKRSALSGVSWSYRDVGTWSNTFSSP